MSVAISNLSATWTSSANVYNAISMNVTATAYDANSSILNLKLNGNSVFSIAADGTANIDFISVNGYGKGNVGDVITSNGSNIITWTSVSSMTNLGSIIFLSGSSVQTLSGLSLTKYRMLNIVILGAGRQGGTSSLYFTSDTTKITGAAASTFNGNILVYLDNGVMVGTIGGTGAVTPYVQSVNFNNANTSITIGIASGTFSTANGTAIVYGIK